MSRGALSLEQRNCRGCGRSFVPVRVGGRHKGIYCSRECRGKEQWKVAKCEQCSAEIRFRDGDPRRFCSQSCASTAINLPNRRRLVRACLQCGKTFDTQNSVKRLHCSPECLALAAEGRRNPNWRGGGLVACAGCGSDVWVSPSRRTASGDVYCSLDCFHRHGFGRTKQRWQTRWGRASRRAGKRADLGDLYVRSSWEANYARYLNFLIRIGQVAQWEYEPKTFEFAGERRGAVHYTPDFCVRWADGREEYHEVKGYLTDKGKSQLRKMSIHYPAVPLFVIGKVEYENLNRRFKSSIPGWE